MDEISRELPPDTTTAQPSVERSKGPEELIAYERGQISSELVVRDRLGDAMLRPLSAMHPGEPEVEPAPAAEPAAAPAAAGEVAAVEAGEALTEAATTADAEADVANVGYAATGQPGSADLPGGADLPEHADPDQGIDAEAAEAAVAAEAEVAEIEADLGAPDEEGLPPVPELTDAAEVARIVFVLMLTAREGLSILRLAQSCNTTQKLVEAALVLLQQQMQQLGLPVDLARTGDLVKWVSRSDAFVHLQRLRGVKKMEKLSPAALETLAVIAYRQPVMRSEIEAVRGVKAGPMLRTLLQHKLVRCTGRADVPGRPLQYGTTQQFLERFGLATLTDLPSVKEWKSLG